METKSTPDEKYPADIVFETIRSCYSDLTDKEFEICRQVVTTCWDLRMCEALYDEVVARESPLGERARAIAEGWYSGDPSIFEDEDEVHATIISLITKGVLNKNQEYPLDRSRKVPAISFKLKQLDDKVRNGHW